MAAERYDNQLGATELARRLGEAMVEKFPLAFDESKTVAMDYACGTGLISMVLASRVKSILGVDISAGMVKKYNARMGNQGIPPEEMRAVCTELKGTIDELDGMKFDIIVCASAFHHFESIETVTRTLTFFLKPGGSLMVADIVKSSDSDKIFQHNASHASIVPHVGGFEEEEILGAFKAAGLQDISFEKATSAKKNGSSVDFFLAKGVKSL
jgi:2-polyprenyl-3-methyl-5-hydroxy-6-metoxy-1,4-benzoquinol methylase